MPVTRNNTSEDNSLEKITRTLQELSATVNDLQNTSKSAELSSLPDPTKHKYISFAKSAVRIAAGLFLVWPGSLVLAGTFLIAAEVLGVVEEVV